MPHLRGFVVIRIRKLLYSSVYFAVLLARIARIITKELQHGVRQCGLQGLASFTHAAHGCWSVKAQA